jgi:hypothetical protein
MSATASTADVMANIMFVGEVPKSDIVTRAGVSTAAVAAAVLA